MKNLEIKNLSKSFDGIKAVDNISLEIEEGKIYSLIGPNGAGKTTFFNLLSGFLKLDKGEIIFRGNLLNKFSAEERAKYFSRTFQLTRNFKNLTLQDNLLLAFESEYESILKFWQYNEKTERDKMEIIRETLKEIKFSRELSAIGKEISYGQAKLLELTRAILHHHEILMLDEPVAGVNPEIRTIIKNSLKDLKEKGSTIFFIEHDINFVMDVSDYVFVMSGGKLISQGEPETIKKDPLVLEAYLGKE
jgi:ABC-type branched-subunit amino acid transport system ATPase component